MSATSAALPARAVTSVVVTMSMVLTLVAFSHTEAAHAASANSPTAYVVNALDNTLTPIDTGANTAGSPISVSQDGSGVGPFSVALSPDGTRAYTTNFDGSVSVVNLATKSVVTTVTPTAAPFEIEATPSGATVYLAVSDTVVPLSTASNTLGPPIAVGAGLSDMVISPDGSTVYAAGVTASAITPISTATNRAGTPIPLPSPPDVLAITPDGKTLFAGLADNDIVAISTASGTAGAPFAVPNGAGTAMVVSPDSKTLYVSTESAGDPTLTSSIVAVNTSTDATSTLAVLPEDPVGNIFGQNFAITPDGKTLYTATASNTVLAVPVATGTPSRPIPAPAGHTASGTAFSSLAVTPDSHAVFTAESDDSQSAAGSAMPIPTSSNSAGPPIPVGVLPLDIVMAADQAPVASFTVTTTQAGGGAQFDGSGSHAIDGSIASYTWSFGDGTTATTTSPTTSHAYLHPGNYAAGLLVTDSAGTSALRYYDGRQMIRNGGPGAAATQTVKVTAGS